MDALVYHAGQIAVQEEAQTTRVAARLADWVGPVREFARGADLVVLAVAAPGGGLEFVAVSGAPPFVEPLPEPAWGLRFPPEARLPAGAACGGLVIHLGLARRARINGRLESRGGRAELVATEAFTLCRKYMAPSVATGRELRVGPRARHALALDDPWIAATLARAETAFLASASPAGMPDVAHRGGPPGFLAWDPARARLAWTEYVGDGVFKSAGNIRATGVLSLLAIDLATGDGVALSGRAEYRNLRERGAPRESPLVQDREDFPAQGEMTCVIARAERLEALMHPRSRIARAPRITSRSTVQEQQPQ
ncbi:MAG: pyridoxamine 5'-phosphate oxidase family protein [Burkholderiales bacterium]|nr:pyridoxamine 5'-phosphate oxidase family protein [Burkholderiales bacterium]